MTLRRSRLLGDVKCLGEMLSFMLMGPNGPITAKGGGSIPDRPIWVRSGSDEPAKEFPRVPLKEQQRAVSTVKFQ